MSAPLRVAIDARTATGAFTGIGRYTTSLVSALAREATDLGLWLIVTERALPGFRFLEAAGVTLYPTSMEIERHPMADLWMHLALPRTLRRERIPILFSCANYIPLFSAGARRVLTIHDLVPFRHPELDPFKFVIYLRSMLKMGAAVADRIVSVSEATAVELEQILGVQRKKIEVIHNGVLPMFRRLSPGELTSGASGQIPVGPYILSVGARIPRKNFGRLIQALAILCARGLPHKLVIAGPPGQSQPELERLVAENKLAGRVLFVGYPGDEQLVALYNRAELFVYPSVYEGFGIPVVEAMACGVPVACSRTSSLPEVAGEAAVTFDPFSPQEIAAACERVLGDRELSAGLVTAGLERAKRFTWEAAARKTAALLRSLV